MTEEISPNTQNSGPVESDSEQGQPVDKLWSIIENMPEVKEALKQKLNNNTEIQDVPKQQITSTQLPFDVQNVPLDEFVNYRSSSSDPIQEMKYHLMSRYNDMSAQAADTLVAKAKEMVEEQFSISKRMPSDPIAAIRTNAVSLINSYLKHKSQEENNKIERAAQHLRIAEREFGVNYVSAKKPEAEKFAAEVYGIPVEDVADLPEDKYARILKSYSMRNLSSNEIIKAVEEQKEIKENIKNTLSKLKI